MSFGLRSVFVATAIIALTMGFCLYWPVYDRAYWPTRDGWVEVDVRNRPPTRDETMTRWGEVGATLVFVVLVALACRSIRGKT